MHSGLRRSLLSLLFIAGVLTGVTARPEPAHALVVTDPGLTSAFATFATTTTAWQLKMLQAIMGVHIVPGVPFPMMVPGGLFGTDSQPIKTGPAVTGLIDYFEFVFWPRWITMEQRIAQGFAKQQAVGMSMNTQMADAQTMSNDIRRAARDKVDTAVNALGVEDVLCMTPSRTQSLGAQIAISRLEEIAASLQNTAFMMGETPMSSKGPMIENLSRLDARIQSGVCTQTGNGGADKVWCTNANQQISNADTVPQPLIHPISLEDENKDSRYYKDYAAMFKANLFPNRAFDSLREDLLRDKDPAAVEILTDRVALATQTNMFAQPFDEALGARKAIPSIAAKDALEAVLKRMDYPDELKKQMILTSGKISRAAAEEIHYKMANIDPQLFVSDYAKGAALNQANRDAATFQKQVDQVVLLYDIREQIKTTNKLLGAMGSVMTAQRFEDIQAKTQGLKANQ